MSVFGLSLYRLGTKPKTGQWIYRPDRLLTVLGIFLYICVLDDLDDVEVIMDKKLLTGKALQQNILKSLDYLPPIPKIVLKAREVIEDPSSSLKDIEKLISVDQALTVNVLKMANSAHYRRVKGATSIHDAAIVLGIKTIGELITMACTSSVLSKTLKGYDISADSMWRHSLSVAFGSKIIAICSG